MKLIVNDPLIIDSCGLSKEKIFAISLIFYENESFSDEDAFFIMSLLQGEWFLCVSFEAESTFDRSVSFSKLVLKETGIEGDTLFEQKEQDGKWKTVRKGLISLGRNIQKGVVYFLQKGMVDEYIFHIPKKDILQIWNEYAEGANNPRKIWRGIIEKQGSIIQIFRGIDGVSVNLFTSRI